MRRLRSLSFYQEFTASDGRITQINGKALKFWNRRIVFIKHIVRCSVFSISEVFRLCAAYFVEPDFDASQVFCWMDIELDQAYATDDVVASPSLTMNERGNVVFTGAPLTRAKIEIQIFARQFAVQR